MDGMAVFTNPLDAIAGAAKMIRIILPWPPSATSANGSQADYRGKARAAKGYKQLCAWECLAQKVKPISWPDNADLPVTITYHPPTRARHDWDNLAKRCKQGCDAVSEAIGVDDGRWWPVTLRKGKVTRGGAVVIEFGGAEPDAVAIPLRGTINGGEK
jgi:crossover junction endodeoxyribonuclease RusA